MKSKIKVCALASLMMLLMCSGMMANTSAIEGTTYPLDDTYVESDAPSQTHGADTTAVAGFAVIVLVPVSSGFLLKFDLSSKPENATVAQLKIWCTNANMILLAKNARTILEVWRIPNDWTEETVTWNNAPDKLEKLGTITVTEISAWYTFKIPSSLVQAGGVVSLRILRSNKIASTSDNHGYKIFTTKEGTSSYRPRIEWSVQQNQWQWLIDLFLIPFNLITTIITVILSIFGLGIILRRKSREGRVTCDPGDLSCQ